MDVVIHIDEQNMNMAKKESIHRMSCIKLLKKIALENPSLNIIIKIHPYEKEKRSLYLMTLINFLCET